MEWDEILEETPKASTQKLINHLDKWCSSYNQESAYKR